jgi:ABC-2 type transport system permease protein
MKTFFVALLTEALKVRRSRVPLFTALGFSLAPLMGGLFMFILQDPARARALGVVSAKAQLAAGTADWPTYLGLLAQATAVGGGMVFAIATAWVFAREFSDRTAKDLLAVPVSRGAIIAAKFSIVAVWGLMLAMMVLCIGLGIGAALRLPGWSPAVIRAGVFDLSVAAVLTLALMPVVALMASAGRGYLPALGLAVLMVFLAQIAAATGWGGWFPWSVPALFSGIAGSRVEYLGLHSYLLVVLVMTASLAATFIWWQYADQTR